MRVRRRRAGRGPRRPRATGARAAAATALARADAAPRSEPLTPFDEAATAYAGAVEHASAAPPLNHPLCRYSRRGVFSPFAFGDFFSLGAFGACASCRRPCPFYLCSRASRLRAFCLSALAALRASFLALASAAAASRSARNAARRSLSDSPDPLVRSFIPTSSTCAGHVDGVQKARTPLRP